MSTKSFEYLEENCYFDTACQSLRPKSVIEAELSYYTSSNSCAGRGNYPWAKKVDAKIDQVRRQILDFVGKGDDYSVVFGQNTTMNINLILHNLNPENISQVVTSEKEHNSVLLPAMSFARRFGKKLNIIERDELETPNLNQMGRKGGLLMLQTTSNLDGSSIVNLPEVVNFAKKMGNLVMLDGTQSLAHHNLNFCDSDFDVLFGSAHKMYGPSLGFMVIKKDLILNLEQTWVGGGSVQSASFEGWELIKIKEELHSRLELGLQDYAAIFGFGESLNWLNNYKVKNEYDKVSYQAPIVDKISKSLIHHGSNGEAIDYINSLSELLFYNLGKMQNNGIIKLLNQKPSPTVSFVAKNISSYELTQKLGLKNIMCRSGFMCSHPYIRENLQSGPLVRVSLGLNNTPKDIAKLLINLEELL